ncbi:MAG: Gfo/Idh/MocA family oxidoreductase [Clostridia bacterium]|nr:Gfo/Idh/MocA family oxidoreductase [Clostridia bacterium]
MIKLAILGCENSHSWDFARVFAPKDGNKIFEDVELLGVFGEPGVQGVEKGMEVIAEKSACPVFADDKDAFLEEADAVMVTARDGANHLKYAENYIKKGIPVWIDKPITRSVEEVLKLVELAKKHKAVLSGGSSLEFAEGVLQCREIVKEYSETLTGAHISAPVIMDSPYGGFWFYTQHLVAMLTTIFGYEIKSVRAMKTANGVHAIYSYENYDVSAFYGGGYTVAVYTDNFEAESVAVKLQDDFYMPELKTFYNVIKTGKADKTTKEYIAPVYILEATVKAFESNEEVKIEIPEI